MCNRANWPKCVVSQVESYESYIKRAIDMVPHARLAERAKARFDFVSYVSAGWYLNIKCNVKAFDDVAPLLLYLRSAGYVPSKMNKQEPEYGTPQRTYTFFDESKDKVIFEVIAQMPNDTDGTCRRVKKGSRTKVVEETIWEIECDNNDVDSYAFTEGTELDAE